MTEHEKQEEARKHFLEAFDEVSASGNWMAVVWKKDDEGGITMSRMTTWRFPKSGFWTAIALMGEKLCEFMTGQVVVPDEEEKESEPLPQAFPKRWIPDEEVDDTPSDEEA